MPGVTLDQNQEIHLRGEHMGIQYQMNGILLPLDINTDPTFTQLLNSFLVKSVSLLDGILPARYGYRTAGVIDIVTKKGCDQQGGDFSLLGGQRSTVQPSFELGGCRGDFGYFLTGLYLHNNIGFSSATPGDAIHDLMNQGQGFGNFTYQLSPAARLHAIIAITTAGLITDWNAGAERLYGFSAAEAIGNLVSIIIPANRMSESADVLKRVGNGEMIASFETVRLRKDGSLTDVSLTVSPVKDEEGRIIGVSKIARNITELNHARQEREALLRSERMAREAAESARQVAEAANRAKDEFLAMLGHELRNPLHVISLATQLLQNPGSLQKARDIISRQSEHLRQLVDDLLDAARVTSGRIVLSRRSLNLGELVSECIGNLRDTGQLDRHTVETDCEAVWVDGDSERLSQIVSNLLSNAVKYTLAGGEIQVRVKACELAILQIRDNGMGIPSEILPRVFDLFARGEFGLQRSPAGLGIGLTLVRRIAELHGGRAEAASDGPGRGSTFTVTLPSVAPPQPRHADGPRKSNEPTVRRRVLLIEDNDDARESLRLLLEASGHEVHEATDGPTGIDKALELKPDIVLIDVGLPGLDGYQVAAHLRKLPACSAARLIAVTGYTQGEYRARAQIAGFHDYLVKPVDAAVLDQIVAGAALSEAAGGDIT